MRVVPIRVASIHLKSKLFGRFRKPGSCLLMPTDWSGFSSTMQMIETQFALPEFRKIEDCNFERNRYRASDMNRNNREPLWRWLTEPNSLLKAALQMPNRSVHCLARDLEKTTCNCKLVKILGRPNHYALSETVNFTSPTLKPSTRNDCCPPVMEPNYAMAAQYLQYPPIIIESPNSSLLEPGHNKQTTFKIDPKS